MISVVFPSTLTSIVGSGLFADCSGLTSISLPTSLTSISGSFTFQNTSLSHVSFTNAITITGKNTFSTCPSLVSVNFTNSAVFSRLNYNSVTTIGPLTFNLCTKLTTVVVPQVHIFRTNDSFNGTGAKSVVAVMWTTSLSPYTFPADYQTSTVISLLRR